MHLEELEKLGFVWKLRIVTTFQHGFFFLSKQQLTYKS